MNNNDRRLLLETIQRINDDYQTSNREYNLNMMDYHRNMNQMINLISSSYNQNRISGLHNYESPRRLRNIQGQNRNIQGQAINMLELELLTGYMNQLTNQLNNVDQPALNNTQLNTYTELVPYDSSMNEQRCPITHEDFQEGEQICRIISCGHYFKPNAIRTWFLRNTVCPVCRHNVLSNNDTSNNPIDASIPQGFFSNIISNIMPYNDVSYNNVQYNDVSYNTITYTFDIPLNNNFI